MEPADPLYNLVASRFRFCAVFVLQHNLFVFLEQPLPTDRLLFFSYANVKGFWHPSTVTRNDPDLSCVALINDLINNGPVNEAWSVPLFHNVLLSNQLQPTGQ